MRLCSYALCCVMGNRKKERKEGELGLPEGEWGQEPSRGHSSILPRERASTGSKAGESGEIFPQETYSFSHSWVEGLPASSGQRPGMHRLTEETPSILPTPHPCHDEGFPAKSLTVPKLKHPDLLPESQRRESLASCWSSSPLASKVCIPLLYTTLPPSPSANSSQSYENQSRKKPWPRSRKHSLVGGEGVGGGEC